MKKVYLVVFLSLALFVCANAQIGQNLEPGAEESKSFSVGGAKFINKTITEKNEAKRFEIAANYPELTGINPTIAAKFNELAEDAVMKEVREFKKTMLAQTDSDLEIAGEKGGNNYLEIRYRVSFVSERILSIGFGNAVYDGGEQPNEYSFTINFDLKNGKKIELSDLFKPDSNYLRFLSNYSINNLKGNLKDLSDEEWLENGAGARPENFNRWNITKKGILIHFDPSQIAAYAAGPQDILIPYNDLKGMLLENAVVAQL